MPVTRTLPPTHRIIRKLLADNSGVQAITTRVTNALPANPQFPLVLVERIGGIPFRWGDDNAQIQISAYGRTDDEAYSLIQACWKACMEYTLSNAEGALTDVRPSLGVREFDDPSYMPPQPRWLFAVIATSHERA